MQAMDTTHNTFQQRFHVLSHAGVGVVMVPTKEVNLALDSLRDYALELGYDFKHWTHTVGWQSLQKESEEHPHRDRCLNPYDALKKINDIDNDGKNAWPKGFDGGIYAMVYPHWVLPKMPNFIQLVKDYVYHFSTTRQRLVLIVPEGVSLPAELENDITILEFALPSKQEIAGIFDRTVRHTYKERVPGFKFPFSEDDIHRIVNLAAGMTEMEVENAFARGMATFRPFGKDKGNAYEWLKKLTVDEFIHIVNEVKTEAIKRSQCLSLMPEAKMEDVAGLELAIEWAKQRAAAFDPKAIEFGVDRPKGMLLVGPPGTGKTLFSKMLGSILRQRMVRLDMGSVFNKYIGESEARIRGVIKMAKAMAPVILLIDEVDKAGGGSKSDNSSEASQRVMSTLLTEMQECQEEVFWIFTANWPDKIDPALLRKGRLDEIFSVLAPNSKEREAVLRVHLRKRKQNPDMPGLENVVDATKGFVSAEIEAIVKDAVTIAYYNKKPVDSGLLLETALQTKPLSLAFPEEFSRMEKWAKNHARPSSPPDEVISTEDKPKQRTRTI